MRSRHTAPHPMWDTWPAELPWRAVAPQLLYVRLLGLLAVGIPTGVLATVLAGLWWGMPYPVLVGVAAVAYLGLRAVVIGRAVRSWGYAEREDDLVITHGVFTRRLSLVPYGRMQFIDISAGPVERMFGLSTVKLHTASAGSDSTVPGLSPEHAAGLRDRLAERAKSTQEGL